VNRIIDESMAAGKFDIFDWKINPAKMTATAAMISYFFIFMQDYGTDQISVQRLISVKSFRGLGQAIVFNSFMDVIVNAILLFIGLGLFVRYQGTLLDESISGTALLPFHIVTALPNGVSGLIITGIFAAAMSSMDSGLNSVSTVIINDFIGPLSSRRSSDAQKIANGRVLTLTLGVCATAMAFYASRIGHIIEVWSGFMGLFAAPVLAMFLLGLLVKRAVFKDWLTGVIPAIIIILLLRRSTTTHWVYLFPVSLTTTMLISVCSAMIRPLKKS
jgi:solute:Na+ symporter, SSS family